MCFKMETVLRELVGIKHKYFSDSIHRFEGDDILNIQSRIEIRSILPLCCTRVRTDFKIIFQSEYTSWLISLQQQLTDMHIINMYLEDIAEKKEIILTILLGYYKESQLSKLQEVHLKNICNFAGLFTLKPFM